MLMSGQHTAFVGTITLLWCYSTHSRYIYIYIHNIELYIYMYKYIYIQIYIHYHLIFPVTWQNQKRWQKKYNFKWLLNAIGTMTALHPHWVRQMLVLPRWRSLWFFPAAHCAAFGRRQGVQRLNGERMGRFLVFFFFVSHRNAIEI